MHGADKNCESTDEVKMLEFTQNFDGLFLGDLPKMYCDDSQKHREKVPCLNNERSITRLSQSPFSVPSRLLRSVCDFVTHVPR